MREKTTGRPLGRVVGALALGALATLSHAADEADPAPTVDALGWMTGTWAGTMGPGTLEENWTRPMAGSIQALVRATAGEQTSMVELIVIEEEEDTLHLRLQQWEPGFKPRSPEPSLMKLVDIGDNTVAFELVGEGDIEKLRYSRDGDSFTIDVAMVSGQQFQIPLTAVR